MRVCRSCGARFEPNYNTLQICCSPPCAASYAKTNRGKAHVTKQKRKEKAEIIETLKTKSDYMRDAQVAFNAFIRERDSDQPCISCDKPATSYSGYLRTGGAWDCGHYRSVGACPELRFAELNAHKQCKRCNRDLSGNAVEYRNRLKQRLKPGQLDWLEGPHDPKHYTREDCKRIAAEYRQKKRDLIKAKKRCLDS